MTASDPEVIKARRLADLLTRLADKLETPLEARAAEIDPEQYDPNQQALAVDAAARATVRRLHDAWRRLDASNILERDAQRRESLLRLCRTHGIAFRELRDRDGARPDLEDQLLRMTVEIYATDVPDHRELITKNAELARVLLRAYARIVRRPLVSEAAEQLCKAMGFPAHHDSVKRSARRRRKRPG